MFFVFGLAKELGIDEPEFWANVIPPQVLDKWIAWHIVRNDSESGRSAMMTPGEARDHLNGKY